MAKKPKQVKGIPAKAHLMKRPALKGGRLLSEPESMKARVERVRKGRS